MTPHSSGRQAPGSPSCSETGHGDRLLIGGDTTAAEARAATGGGPGMPYLLRLRPAIERELGAATATRLFVTNPARAFRAGW